MFVWALEFFAYVSQCLYGLFCFRSVLGSLASERMAKSVYVLFA